MCQHLSCRCTVCPSGELVPTRETDQGREAQDTLSSLPPTLCLSCFLTQFMHSPLALGTSSVYPKAMATWKESYSPFSFPYIQKSYFFQYFGTIQCYFRLKKNKRRVAIFMSQKHIQIHTMHIHTCTYTQRLLIFITD